MIRRAASTCDFLGDAKEPRRIGYCDADLLHCLITSQVEWPHKAFLRRLYRNYRITLLTAPPSTPLPRYPPPTSPYTRLSYPIFIAALQPPITQHGPSLHLLPSHFLYVILSLPL